jgi:outer membrane immunogenic protein
MGCVAFRVADRAPTPDDGHHLSMRRPTMKNVSCGLVACVLVSAPIAAGAADVTPPPPMVTKAPAAALPTAVAANPDWSGFYLGINGGVLDVDAGGGVLGGTLGYNFQTGPVVLGVEGDLDAVFPNGGGDTSALGTIRGRLGYTFNWFMPYFTAGYALSGDMGSGLAIGGGAEFRLSPTISLKAEYIRLDLDDVPDNMVRLGLNWRFSPGAPVVARF